MKMKELLARVVLLVAFAVFQPTCDCAQAANDDLIEIGNTGFISNDFRPFFYVNVRGIKTTCIIDTGSAFSVIDAELAAALEITIDAKSEPDAPCSVPQTVRFPNGDSRPIRFLILDLTSMREASKDPIYGIIGMSILDSAVLQFDFDSRLVKMLSMSPILDDREYVKLSRSEDRTAAIDVEFGGRVLRLKVDSGNDSAIQLRTDSFVDVAQLLRARVLRKPTAFLDAGGVQAGWRYFFASPQFSQHSLDCVLVTQGSREWSSNSVGKLFLRRFNSIIDFRNNSLTIAKSQYYTDPDSDSFGMVISTKMEHLVIEYVLSGSVADLAGVRPADLITAVECDGKRFSSKSDCYRMLRFPTRSSLSVFVARRGESMTFVLAPANPVVREGRR